MATANLYQNETERKLHFRAIQLLARDFNIPEEEIQVLYETTLNCLSQRARIRDYLPIIVSRNVRDMM